MIALSYPQTFALNLAQTDGQIVQTSGPRQVASEEVVGDGPVVLMHWDPLYSDSYGYGYSRYGYRNGLGYNGYYPDYWYLRGPVVITRPSQTVEAPRADTRGKMVRGSGYTRPDDRQDGGSSGTPRSSTSGGSGSGSSGGGSSTGSSGGEPRTAKPRSP